MTTTVTVLLVETDELELHERVEQLLMDGYAVDADHQHRGSRVGPRDLPGADVALPSESSGLLVAAGLEALVRRAGAPPTRVARVGSLTVDQDARVAEVAGRAVRLSRLEFDLLATLASDPRRTFTRGELTRQVWGHDADVAGPSRTVDSHAHRLRQKLDQAGAESMVQTVRGVGWRLTR